MDAGDLAYCVASAEQAELLAERTAHLLRELDDIDERVDRLTQLMLTMYAVAV
jgi:hypothetical protein